MKDSSEECMIAMAKKKYGGSEKETSATTSTNAKMSIVGSLSHENIKKAEVDNENFDSLFGRTDGRQQLGQHNKSAQTQDEFQPKATAHFQACRIGDHLLKALELGMDMVLSGVRVMVN